MTTQSPLFAVDMGTVQLLLLGVARLGGMLFLTPPFGSPAVPAQVRLPLAVALLLPVWPSLAAAAPPVARDTLGLAALVAREAVVGLTIGFVARMVLAAAAFAAELVGTKIGFGLAAAVDPMMGGQVTVLTRLYDWTMLGLFLALDAHHLVLGAVLHSFQAVPLGGAVLEPAGAAAVVSLGGRIFTVALALVAPTLGVLFVANLVLVLASRSVPQLSLMVVGWPITVLLGLVLLLGNIDLMGSVVAREITALESVLVTVLRGFAGGR